jgi:hypothetical protein
MVDIHLVVTHSFCKRTTIRLSFQSIRRQRNLVKLPVGVSKFKNINFVFLDILAIANLSE